MTSEDQLIKQRLEKLKELMDKGIKPYEVYKYKTNSCAKEVFEKNKDLKKEDKSKELVRLAGRVMNLRFMGKASFGHIQDNSGKIQFYVREDDIGEKNYNLFKKLDLGDFIGVEGNVFRTKMGEISIWVKKLEILCKALRPLPEKWHGLKDVEIRYRQRYVDLIVNPNVKEVFEKRSKIIKAMREFLDSKGYLEVEIPTLQQVYGGANARPFTTHLNALNIDLYMSISPELYLKRLIVGGFDKVFTICKNFRNEGVDKTHNPEFTMMECYSAYEDYEDMMKLTEEMVSYIAKKVNGSTKVKYQGREIDFKKPWMRMTIKEAIKKYVKIDVNKLSDKELKEVLINYNIEYEGDFSRGLAIELIFEELVEDKLIQPIFITDYPKESTPLCKLKRGNNELIERFEPFVNGWEIGNAYSELNDPILQKKLLREQEEKGRGGDEEAQPYDDDFVRALEYGMPPTGGLGIGIDRLVMLLTDSATIRDVILFPIMKPQTDE